jgi:hypothetical protein
VDVIGAMRVVKAPTVIDTHFVNGEESSGFYARGPRLWRLGSSFWECTTP